MFKLKTRTDAIRKEIYDPVSYNAKTYIHNNKYLVIKDIDETNKEIIELGNLLEAFERNVNIEGINQFEKENWDKFINALMEMKDNIAMFGKTVDKYNYYMSEEFDKNVSNAARKSTHDNIEQLYKLIEKQREIKPRFNSFNAINELFVAIEPNECTKSQSKSKMHNYNDYIAGGIFGLSLCPLIFIFSCAIALNND